MRLGKFRDISLIGSADIIGTAISSIFWLFLASQIPPEDYGEILAAWSFPEFEKPKRSRKWYIWGVIILAILIILSLSQFTVNLGSIGGIPFNMSFDKNPIFIGILDATLIHPREIFSAAISSAAASIILVHNHPSNSLIASKEDIQITQEIKQAGKLLGIRLLDHIILTNNSYLSMADEAMI